MELSKKNKQIISIGIIVLVVIANIFIVKIYILDKPEKPSLFSFSTKSVESDIKVEKSSEAEQAQKTLNKLDISILNNDKFLNLKEHKVEIPNISELNVGKKNPFEQPPEESNN